MKIKRIEDKKAYFKKAYYSYCAICGRGVDSDELIYYDGICENCWRSVYFE